MINKRVSTKFYHENFENPQPGCVIDQKITRANEFYLISQKTTQGTVTPTKYKIFHNDLSAEPNIILDIQTLSFKLCHLYFNLSGSINIPAPVKYAHCLSKFIGSRYSAIDPNQFLPNDQLINKSTLFYI